MTEIWSTRQTGSFIPLLVTGGVFVASQRRVSDAEIFMHEGHAEVRVIFGSLAESVGQAGETAHVYLR